MWLVACWCSRQQLAWVRVRVRVRVRVVEGCDALKRVRNGRKHERQAARTASGRATYLPTYLPCHGLWPRDLPTYLPLHTATDLRYVRKNVTLFLHVYV